MDKSTIEKIKNLEKGLEKQFEKIDDVALINQEKVLASFCKHGVAGRHFAGSTGYGYGDIGRVTLGQVFTDIVGAEEAIVSPLIMSGTHAIAATLFGVLRPGDTLVCATGKPYDTLDKTIKGSGFSDLKIGSIIIDSILGFTSSSISSKSRAAIASAKAVFLGRSRGYEWRETYSIFELKSMVDLVRELNPTACIIVDNCYGEFVEILEPTQVGADLICGSLIKNPGGGIAPTGGYIAGKSCWLKGVHERLSAPGIGGEVGSYIAGYLPFFQGLFLASHVTAGALKASLLFRQYFAGLGYEVSPAAGVIGGDIISAKKFGTPEPLLKFAQTVQANSPVDSFATPMPWDMPGYEHQVVMAAGAFVEGSSIELSVDAPIREPYIAYLQGALTYEHAKVVVARLIDGV